MKVVTPDQYVDELNMALQADEDFTPGMRFLSHPRGATGGGITGYAWEGPHEKTMVFARVALRVAVGCQIFYL